MLPEDKKEDRIKKYVEKIHDYINEQGYFIAFYIYKEKSKEEENKKIEEEENKKMIDNCDDIIALYNSNPAYSKEDDNNYSNCYGLKAFFNKSTYDSKSPNEDKWIEVCFAISEEKIPKRFKGKPFACGG